VLANYHILKSGYIMLYLFTKNLIFYSFCM